MGKKRGGGHMKLTSCKKCGCVLDLEEMSNIFDWEDIVSDIIKPLTLGTYEEGSDGMLSRFFCPICKEVNV